MSAQPSPYPLFRAVDSNNNPLVFGKLFTYAAGTTNPQASYTDSTQGTPNTNPVLLNARGEAAVWLDPSLTYKLALQNAQGAQIWSQDQVPGGYTLPVVGGYVPFSQLLPTVNTQTFVGGNADAQNIYFKRTANYSGGSAGFVNSVLRCETDVTSAGTGPDEWTAVFVMRNSSTTGQQVAAYRQGIRMTSTTGETWAGTDEVIDSSAQANPSVGLIGVEVDLRANGTDTNEQRVAVDVVVTRPYSGGVPSGAAMHAFAGVRVQDGGDSSATVDNCFVCQSINFGSILTAMPGTSGVYGFNFANATLSSGAGIVAPGHAYIWNGATHPHDLVVQAGELGLDYLYNGTLQTRLMVTGGLQVHTTQVVGDRDTGWTAMTGTPDKASSFATGSVTLAQLAGRVMSLQAALTTHGLIGT
jgi:hypothetical protein